jgi:hypothetical protein
LDKVLAVAVVTFPLIGFGAAFAQNTPPAPIQPPAATQQNQPLKTKAPPTGHSAAQVSLYKTESDAKSRCGSDDVVWANPGSHALHDPGTKYYGKTKQGGYVCKSVAIKAGYHEPK